MAPNRTRTVAIVAALLVISAVALPASVAAADGATLSVDVDQQSEDGDAVVTVYENNSTVENATVEVNTSGNYSGNGTYTTDADGSVVLPAPNETVDVTLTAEYNDSNVTETVTLVPLNESLDVSVEQEQGENATVTVTQFDDPVENASVNVSTAENVSYAGNGSYETSENGTVELPAPEENLTVTVSAASGDLTDTTDADLIAAVDEPAELDVTASQDDDGGVSIAVTAGDETVDEANVTIEGDYEYAGTYTAHNGTLSLPAPTENGTIDVTATVDNQTANETLELVVPTDDNPNNDFAESLVAFIDFMKGDTDGPLGQAVSEFVHENNPASDKAQGPPEHAGPNAAENGDEDDEGNETERRGPPDHAGPPADDDGDDDGNETDSDENETDSDENETDVDDLESDDVDDGDDAKDDEDDDNETDDDEEAEADEENETDDGDDGGPPEHAGPN